MRISVTQAVERALAHSKAILFDTFAFRKWLGLSLCFYLNYLFLSWPDYGQSRAQPVPDYARLMREYPLRSAGIAAATLVLLTFSGWVQSRAKFMFLDDVLNNSGAVREPWKRMRPLGNSLFPLQFGILFVAVLAMMAGYLLFVASAGPGFSTGNTTPQDVYRVLLPMYLITFVTWGGLWFVYIVIGDFMVPIMYRRNVGAREAFGLFLSDVLRDTGPLLRFVGMKCLLWLAALVLMAIGTCISSCVVALPMGLASMALADSPWLVVLISLPVNFVYAALFLPIFVLFRLYPIYFLEQFGPEWRFFEGEEGEAEAGAGAM